MSSECKTRESKTTGSAINRTFDSPLGCCDKNAIIPLEPPDEQYWQAAVGYVELGMFQDANDQLEKIDPFNRAAPEVLAVRLAIYHGLKKWELMREIAKRLADFQPDDIQWVTSYAYATRRAESIPAAKEILLNAEPKFPKEPIIKYNLACYFCQMGDIQNARDYLKKAFEIDLKWRMAALEDEDLKPLWDSLLVFSGHARAKNH